MTRTAAVFTALAVGIMLNSALAAFTLHSSSGIGPKYSAAAPGRSSEGTAEASPALSSGINTLLTPAQVGQLIGDPSIRAFVMTNLPGIGSMSTIGSIKVISTSAYHVVARTDISANSSPRLAADPTNGSVFYSNVSGLVTLASGSTLAPLATWTLTPRVTAMVFDPVDGDLWVAESCDPASGVTTAGVTAIHAADGSVVATVPLPCNPTRLLVDAANGNLFVLDGTEGNLTVISGTTLTALTTFPNVAPALIAGLPPTGTMTFDPRDGNVYVRCATPLAAGCIAVFNGTGAPVALRHLSLEIQDTFVIDGAGRVDFLAWSNSSAGASELLMSMAPPNGTLSELAVAACPEDALSWNPVSHVLFAVAHCGDTGEIESIAFYTGASLALGPTVAITNISFFQYPISGDASSVDPTTGIMVVAAPASTGGSGVGLVGPFPVTFRAAIYAPGVIWTLSITYPSGFVATYTTTDTGVTVWVPNGSFAFAVAVPVGYAESRTSGTFTMAGGPVGEDLAFSWAWWFWLLLALGGVALAIGVRYARRARIEFRIRRAPAVAKLRYDLEHRLTADRPEDDPFFGPR